MIKVERSLPSTAISSWLNYSNQGSVVLPPTDGLSLFLDSYNTSSYPGSGTVWYDISGNNNNYNINSSAYQTSGNIKFMNFSGSYGCAKNSSDINYASTGKATIVLFSQVLNSTSSWRTLVRSYSADHQVIIQSGANALGMYDNDGAGFISSGVDVTNVSGKNLTSGWNMLVFKMSNSSPYYQFLLNDNSSVLGSITNGNATFTRGWGSIGAYHNGNSTDVNTASQYWGNISVFMVYNRHITSEEQQVIYNYYSGVHGL